jgi:hypothetical protein
MATKEHFMAELREAASQPETDQQAGTPDVDPQAGTPEPHEAAGTQPPGDDAPPDPESASPPPPEQADPPAPTGAKDWLADAGLDIAELYPMVIPGTDITFEQAKAAAPDIADVSRLKLDVQKQRDELSQQQTDGNQQLQATLQALVNAVGREKVEQAISQAPEAVQKYRDEQREIVRRFRPDSDYETDLQGAAKRAAVYGIDPNALAASAAGLQRAFMRLDQLETYVDALREPQKPAKQVRKVSKKDAGGPRGKSGPAVKTGNRRKDRFMAEIANASRLVE